MADVRIVDVDTILSKWHDLLKERWPNFPCQTFQMFMHNNTQELVRCKDCKHRHSSEFSECRPEDAFCSDAEKMDEHSPQNVGQT